MGVKKVFQFMLSPNNWLYKLVSHYPSLIKDDRKYIEYIWKHRMNYPLNLDNPQTFNEKLQWLKLYDRKPLYTTMVDKYEAKKYVASIIGDEYIIPTLGVWDRFDDIDFEKLPDQFVLKCTHDSGGLVICKDKSNLDIVAAKKKIEKSLKRNFWMAAREWPYKNVKPRIIAEKYMSEGDGDLKDYKIINFDGEPKIIEIDYNRFVGHLRNLYTTQWERIKAVIEYPTDEKRDFDKPAVLSQMLALAKQLSKDIPFVRTDFYLVDNQIYFGELTFYHEAGLGKIDPQAFDRELGEWIILPGMGGAILIKKHMVMLIRDVELKDNGLNDYKFFCFNGEVKMMFIATDRQSREEPYFDFYDMNGNHIDMRHGHPNAPTPPACPSQFELMKQLAAKLSVGFPTLRVDFYESLGRVYFGELTFYHHTGMVEFEPREWDYTMGSWIKLNKDQ